MSGFGAYYKGEVSEVTMGHETGIFMEHATPAKWTATTVDSARDYTTITFSAGTSSPPLTGIFESVNQGILKVPLGMLIG